MRRLVMRLKEEEEMEGGGLDMDDGRKVCFRGGELETRLAREKTTGGQDEKKKRTGGESKYKYSSTKIKKGQHKLTAGQL